MMCAIMYLFQPSYSKNISDAYLKNVKTFITGLSQAGGRGGGGHVLPPLPTVFGRLVNYLNQGGGHIMPTKLLRSLPDFQTLRRPFISIYFVGFFSLHLTLL